MAIYSITVYKSRENRGKDPSTARLKLISHVYNATLSDKENISRVRTLTNRIMGLNNLTGSMTSALTAISQVLAAPDSYDLGTYVASVEL